MQVETEARGGPRARQLTPRPGVECGDLLTQLLAEKSEELEETKKRYEEYKEKLSGVRRSEVEAVSVVDDHTKAVDELTRKIDQGRRQLDTFKLQAIPYVCLPC